MDEKQFHDWLLVETVCRKTPNLKGPGSNGESDETR